MCLILFSYRVHEEHELLLLANRDEFHDRPALQADFWGDAPDVLGGRDLRSGGSWLGVTTGGRVAAVTNVREPGRSVPDARSRGFLVQSFLESREPALDAATRILDQGQMYNGFNLLLYDTEHLVYVSNRIPDPPRIVTPGTYGLSNAALDTPWPKVTRGKEALDRTLASGRVDVHTLLPILEDTTRAADHELPSTGVPREWERTLSSPCI
ncbi:MAG: hypothetical protein COV99_06250, partial [Bacteroidetes bacterium CG12_big_fil_rev_8_21_14_0_65_60_17]